MSNLTTRDPRVLITHVTRTIDTDATKDVIATITEMKVTAFDQVSKQLDDDREYKLRFVVNEFTLFDTSYIIVSLFIVMLPKEVTV